VIVRIKLTSICMCITEALEVPLEAPVLIVDGLGTGHQNAQISKATSSAVVNIRFLLPRWV
jgi:hypothetical protein